MPLDFGSMGSLIDTDVRRVAWRDTLRALHEAASPDGPLEGWAFHGTCDEHAGSIMADRVTTTHAVVNSARRPDAWRYVQGTHWGTPAVAGFYAEDLIERFDEPSLELAIVAASISDLMEWGTLHADGQTVDCPLDSRLPLTLGDIEARWEQSAKGWRDAWELHGTFVVQGSVGHEDLHLIRDAADVEELIRSVAPLADALSVAARSRAGDARPVESSGGMSA